VSPFPFLSTFLFLSNLCERNDSEIVDVPEDSADAKKWSLWKPPEGQNEAATPRESGSGTPTPSIEETSSAAAAAAAATAVASSSSSSVPPLQAQPLTTTKRPSRRKPKLQLAELPSVGSRKGKKLTTLEKSALDWKAHVDAPGEPELASQLEANRRGGGYLEKVEFLRRVGDRKDEAFEANKDHKRHRR
jgi:bucentaur or craniofacial development protein